VSNSPKAIIVDGKPITAQNGIQDWKESYIAKPEPMTNEQGLELFQEKIRLEKEDFQQVRFYNYRPWDGAHATKLALLHLYNHEGFQRPQAGMFGSTPATNIVIKTGPGINDSVTVPWGEIYIPEIKATLNTNAHRHEQHGLIYEVTLVSQKRFETEALALLDTIQSVLNENSIYRGRTITAKDEPEFIDTKNSVNPNFLVFRRETERTLKAELFLRVKHPEVVKAAGLSITNNTLLSADFGTGKSSIIAWLCQVANEHGCTVIQATASEIVAGKQLVNMYGEDRRPSVLIVEDVEIAASSRDRQRVSDLLEQFDGMQSKGRPTMVVMTTNYPEKIDPGFLRAGRIHTFMQLGDFDQESFTRLVKLKVEGQPVDRPQFGDPSNQNHPALDYEAIYKACAGYTPAYMNQVIDKARILALSNRVDWLEENHENTWSTTDAIEFTVSTDDLVDAALALRAQWDQQQSNSAGIKEPTTFEKSFTDTIYGVVSNAIEDIEVSCNG
jgi:hypothetical protein